MFITLMLHLVILMVLDTAGSLICTITSSFISWLFYYYFVLVTWICKVTSN